MDRIRVGIEVFLPIQSADLVDGGQLPIEHQLRAVLGNARLGFGSRLFTAGLSLLGRAFFESGIFLELLGHHLFQFYPR